MNKTILFKKKIFLAVTFFFITLTGFAQEVLYTNPANNGLPANRFTVPAGVTSVTLAAWGGGGGGGGSNINGAGGNGGGGGGATSRTIDVSAGNFFDAVVGAGGAAGSSAGGAGGNGGLSSIIAATPLVNMTANGGQRGLGNAAAIVLGTTSSGGTASDGTVNVTGSNGTRVAATGGFGGNSGAVLNFLAGAGGTPAANSDGAPGGFPGGGGSGGERTGTGSIGGAGGVGAVYIRYITVTAATSPLCVGGTITIDGSFFATTGITNVVINGVACTSVNVVSSTRITAVVAPGTTSGIIEINNPNGTNNGRTTIINPSPTANAGSALAAICNTSSTVALGGSFGGGATSAVWSDGGVGGTFTNNSGTTPGTTTWTPPIGYVGTATLTLTTSGGSCGVATASKTQAVNGPIANAGAALATICQGGTTVGLGGSFGGTATAAVWSDGGIGGTFTNNTGTTPNTATWTPPAAYTGTATLTLTTSGGACGTTTASKTQNVISGIVATVGPSQTNFGTLISESLGGNVPAMGTGLWTVVSSPGSATVTFDNASSESAIATVSLNGAYVFRWTITSSCGTSSSDIAVSFLPVNDPIYTIYYENFDNSNGGWTSAGTTGSWGYTNTASSPHRGEGGFWAVNTTAGTYPNNALTTITSPTISTLGYNNVKLFIDLRYLSEDNADGIQIQYSLNNGTSWTTLGTGTSASWYTKTTVAALNASLGTTVGWDGDSSVIGTAAPFPAPLSQFIEKSIQSNVLNNVSTLRIRAVFASNGTATAATGVAIDNIIIKGNPIIPVPDPIAGPGNVNGSLKLWLKSNTGTSTIADGTALNSWSDQAYDNNSVGIVGNSPIYRDNSTRNINFNPVVDFSAASAHVMKGKGGFWSQDYYVVIKTNGIIDNSAASRQVPISGRLAASSFHLDGTALGLGSFTQRYTDEVVSHNLNSVPATPAANTQSYGRAYTSTTDSYNQQTIIFNIKTNSTGNGTEIYKNGKRIDNTTGQAGTGNPTFVFSGELNFSDFNNIQYNLGVGRFTLAGNVASSYLDGRMTEVVSYSQAKTTLEQQKIQSYLAIKNGVTLHAPGSTTPDDLCDTNYVNSDGTTIWNAVANSGFNYDIAGIGRDDNTLLNQKQSKTENPVADISMGLGDLRDVNTNNLNTFDSDKKFLVWGNNRGTLAAQAPVIVNISSGITPALTTNVDFISIGRTWKVVETGGNVPTVKVSLPSVMLTATITPPGDFLMFISNTPSFDPTAEYRIMTANGSNLETTYDFNGTKYITFGYAPERTAVRCIKFDGVNDYLDAGNVLNLNTSFTVSAWVNRNSANRTILSKRNNTFTQGYDLCINAAGRAEMSWMVGGTKHTITSNVVIPSGKWHHIGVIYDGPTTTARMYIDGVTIVSNTTMPNVPATTQSFLIAAADDITPTSLFNGSIDEVRVWNVALTEAQFRYVMNQEILSNTTLSNGSVIPNIITLNDISSVPWANLQAYYPMSTYTYTNAKDVSNNNYTAALRNLTTVDLQTAPLPYESAADGNWETVGTWTNSTVQDLPYSTSIEDPTKTIDWNIVRTTHNITSIGNKTVLGLFVNSNNLIATNDSKIEVSHYLKLDGKIDLVGRSQLVQKLGSDLDPTSSGSLERDQQGQGNRFNYNYWSSPVGSINNTTNNNSFTVAGVLRDGTNPAAPVNINWVNGFDGSLTNPISLARYWIFKFDNLENNYANWTRIGENGTLSASKGFTMKGPGTSGTQNLTFIGKPNNGTINNTVGADQLLLIGNPYPSALDADKFINDNIGSLDTSTTDPVIDGALYFWEHFATNSSHELVAYQGGYGIRNLAGGVAPSATGVDFISGAGTTSKSIPNRYIPVGQAFFVIGIPGTGGTVIFNNSQREFITETNALSQDLYRIPNNPKDSSHWTDNSNATIEKDTHKRIRLGFNVMDKEFHRQVLLAFMDEKATSDMDNGYDAFNIDDSPSDMYLLNGDNELAIQGEGYFDENASFPIGVRIETAGKVSFNIDALENFDQNQNVFIYDNETNTYNNINNKPFEIELPQGYFKNRFSLRFRDKTLGVKDVIYDNNIQVAFTRSNNVLNITNRSNDNTVNTVSLFNIQGKLMATWAVSEKEQTSIKIPIENKTSGVYIVKLKTSKGNINKKIIIK
ncbi:T9SS type A sorting domain-containing protein [Flavobacterium glaciei]|uniref:Secreted protein (Por secretion system target) n=1 Tax=Flavobacterium glaciei TaxID=386300 RepID=A0A562Q5F9_9FLAO|nr:LamG-like jellyroll fold domain-containing protein [Flavobacterium glaciei]RDI58208.1 putative secreted protein (Por secretion system target) [Flavobacterium glaciei]TWI51995.1 putative secreted protein (Por secretion system target) [Flavobacterium glaciei]